MDRATTSGERPAPGVAEVVAPGVVRILAPNPSPMTHWGTNTYLVGEERLVVVDPGPDLAPHLESLLAAIRGRPVDHVVVTHTHLDHSALAPRLAGEVGAPTAGFGPSGAGRSAIMARLAAEGEIGGGEGLDTRFVPDVALADGDRLGAFRVLHTPGHLGTHICLLRPDLVLTGDHVMGWSTSLVSPPDGDLGDFMRSCERLAARVGAFIGDGAAPTGTDAAASGAPAGGRVRALPGHGATIPDLGARLAELVAHRRARERQILAALARAPGTAPDLARRIYHDTPSALLPAASRNVLAHLVDLATRNLATCRPPLCADSVFSAT